MAIGEYLKQAAGQLRRAALVRKTESDDLRRSIAAQEQEMSKQMNHIKEQIAAIEAESRRADNEVKRALKHDEVKRLQQHLKDMHAEFERQKQSLVQTTKMMDQQYADLNNQASQFERQASSY
jgi:hypothetical protein